MAPRANALGIVEHQGRILVEVLSGKHSKGTGTFYRPPGGGIEHGEHSQEAMVREIREELGAEAHRLELFGVLENIYRIDEFVGHEISFIYKAEFADSSLYEQERFTLTDGEHVAEAVWMPVRDFVSGANVIYPNGLAELLAKHLEE